MKICGMRDVGCWILILVFLLSGAWPAEAEFSRTVPKTTAPVGDLNTKDEYWRLAKKHSNQPPPNSSRFAASPSRAEATIDIRKLPLEIRQDVFTEAAAARRREFDTGLRQIVIIQHLDGNNYIATISGERWRITAGDGSYPDGHMFKACVTEFPGLYPYTTTGGSKARIKQCCICEPADFEYTHDDFLNDLREGYVFSVRRERFIPCPVCGLDLLGRKECHTCRSTKKIKCTVKLTVV